MTNVSYELTWAHDGLRRFLFSFVFRPCGFLYLRLNVMISSRYRCDEMHNSGR